MRQSTSTLLQYLFLLAPLAGVVVATPCGVGRYTDNNGQCQYCPPGSYQNDGQNQQNSCQQAQQGDYACGPQTVGGVSCYGATGQSQCQPGTYAANRGQSACTACQPGYKCPGTAQTQQQPCSPGEYVDVSNYSGQDCKPCAPGTFNNVNAASSCCQCCAGTFNNINHQTHCFSCAEQTSNARIYSLPGATDVGQCSATPFSGVTNAPSCSNTMNNSPGQAFCPPTTGGGNPNPSAINKRSRISKCARGLIFCPHYAGIGGFECIDPQNDPESCGGCVGFEGHGEDCTSIPNVTSVKCEKRKCSIKSCIQGYGPSADGSSCEPSRSLLQAQGRKRHAVLDNSRH